jgi:hypothetical protein
MWIIETYATAGGRATPSGSGGSSRQAVGRTRWVVTRPGAWRPARNTVPLSRGPNLSQKGDDFLR